MPLQLLGGAQLTLGTHVHSDFVEVQGEVVVDQELLKDRRRPEPQIEVEPGTRGDKGETRFQLKKRRPAARPLVGP